MCLAAAAVVLGWPAGAARARWRVATTGASGQQPSGRGGARWRRWWARIGAGRQVPVLDRRWMLGAAALTGPVVGVVAGPVAGLAVGVYTALAVRAAAGRQATRTGADARTQTLDGLCALAADLRAGLPPTGLSPTARSLPDERLGRLASAVWRLAEQTGAPAADLVERIEADARVTDRSHAAATAQAAGARATAWLLAALPLGGIALGYGIGVDPLRVLLHTPVGAACAAGALVLQLAGLAWADRLSGGPAGAPR
jgi:tight adherence protein B